ncbi:MAG: hypothetical protein A2075_17500 [Geobacteraceae bacterium GWC2_58_44]|nr:MAG: hypothetical protein A2075_17500 [Geobacteraceae bacterium GWC2_58_44]HBG06788.1 hypothetical protein [Geobacter sp.]
MAWEAMTIDEYAAFQRACGMHVVKIQDTWWVEPRPFFFRPLFPFAEVTPGLLNYPMQALVGGVMHPVPAGASSNSYVHMLLYDKPQSYSIDASNCKHRQIIKKSLEVFSARRITDLNLFIEEAFTIYKSFYARTRYFYKKERLNKEFFVAWAKPLFEHPKIVVMGAYHENNLSAVEILYQVEDVIIEDVYFSDTKSQPLQVTDFMTHTVREAAKATDARYIFTGFPSGKKTLDQSKTIRGCKILKLPAYFKINPLVLQLVKMFMRESYEKLVAITSFSDNDKLQSTGDR